MGSFLRCLHFTPVDGQKYYKFTEIITVIFVNVMNVAIGRLNYHCNLKSVDIRWSKFSSNLVKLTNSSRSEKTSRFKLRELRVFVFIFILLSDDNGARSASYSSSEFFLVFKFYKKWAFFVLIMNWQISPCCLVQGQVMFTIFSLRTRQQVLICKQTKEY